MKDKWVVGEFSFNVLYFHDMHTYLRRFFWIGTQAASATANAYAYATATATAATTGTATGTGARTSQTSQTQSGGFHRTGIHVMVLVLSFPFRLSFWLGIDGEVAISVINLLRAF